VKLKSLRCGICDSWNGAYRNHCAFCGSTRAIKVNGHPVHLDYAKLTLGQSLQIVRGVPSDLALRLQMILN
jgi:hypothetical protein